jgi:hypothetical protein
MNRLIISAVLLVVLLLTGIALFERHLAREVVSANTTLRRDTESLRQNIFTAQHEISGAQTELTRPPSPPKPASDSAASEVRNHPPAASGSEVDRAKAAAVALSQARDRRASGAIRDMELIFRPEFDKLGLPPEKWDRYEELMIEVRLAQWETQQRARDQHLPDNEVAVASKQVDPTLSAQIRSLLGDASDEALNEFAAATPDRNEVQALAGELLYSNAPLEPDQIQQLLQLLKEDRVTSVAPSALERAQSVLSPPQLEAWKSLKAESQLKWEEAQKAQIK